MAGFSLTDFGIYCRRLRADRGHTLASQSAFFGISPTSIAKLEEGRIRVSPDYVQELGLWLKLSANEVRQCEALSQRRLAAREHLYSKDERNKLAMALRNISTCSPYSIAAFAASGRGERDDP